MLAQQWHNTAPTPLQAWMAIAELSLTGNLKDIFFHDTNTYINTFRATQGAANRCFFFTKGAEFYISPLLEALGRNTRQAQNLYLNHGNVAINLRLNPQYDGVSWIIQDQTPQHKKPQTHHELMALRHLFPKELQNCT